MVDDFIVCIDRIIASTACLESSVTVSEAGDGIGRECERMINVEAISDNVGVNVKNNEGSCSSSNKAEVVVECRICQEEDQVQVMEAPCSCNGTLKFAHRKCIQRWCNKKGSTICEICNQVFSPNYSLPHATTNDITAIGIRQGWGHNTDLEDSVASAERQLLQTEYEDYAVAQTSSIACLGSVVLILVIILLVRQALMIRTNSVTGQGSSIFFNVQMSILQFAGAVLPWYAMARSWYMIQSRRRRFLQNEEKKEVAFLKSSTLKQVENLLPPMLRHM